MTSSEFNFSVLKSQSDGGFFQLMFEQLDDGVIVTDNQGVVLFWSKSAEGLYELSAEEMVGHHINKLAPGFDMDYFKQRLIDGNPSLSGEWNKEFEDGQQRTFRITTKSLADAQVQFIGVMWLSKEITKEKKLQADLEEAIIAARETSRLKSLFMSNLSHEIKTPIAGIIGLADLIQSITSDEDLRSYAQIQKDSCERLLTTMSSILEMSKMDADHNQFSEKICNLPEVVSELIPPYVVLASGKGLKFDFTKSSEKILTLVDPVILSQIVSNLISNAVKYTLEGSVGLDIHPCPQNPKHGCLIVTDTGIGMDNDFAVRLFEPYTREMREEELKREGHGLGLSIAYQYIKILGWNIEVSSFKGKGSAFKVLFPLFDASEVTSFDV
jgi:PAS domain S-box-containing protein